MSKVIIGKVGGEEWVGTNDGGVGRLLFKLQESEEVFDNSESLRKENQRLNADMKGAICLMSPSWQHAASKEQDLMTRYVTMAENQFKKKNEEIERLTAIATKHATVNDERYELLEKQKSDIEKMLDQLFRHEKVDAWLVCKMNDMLDDVNHQLEKSRIEAEKGDGICN